MAIVKIKDKKTGTIYVYESKSYWDAEKKQARNKRKLIGKLDENGVIVPTGNVGRKKKKTVSPEELGKVVDELERYKQECLDAEIKIKELERTIANLESEKQGIANVLERLLAQIKGE